MLLVELIIRELPHIIRIIEMLAVFGAFALVIPFGNVVIGAFLALVGALRTGRSSGTTRSDGAARVKIGPFEFSWKGAAGLGLIIAGIAVIIMASQHNKSEETELSGARTRYEVGRRATPPVSFHRVRPDYRDTDADYRDNDER